MICSRLTPRNLPTPYLLNSAAVMDDQKHLRLALRLARRGYGRTSPNPMVGAVLVKSGKIIGEGWHRRAGEPHAEIEALRDAELRGHQTQGATLYVTLEPCCTHGRTPPCTDAIIAYGIREVVAGATDPNPRHRGEGFSILKRAGVKIVTGVLAEQCERLNEAFNHWIVHRTPLVIVKTAMTLDGKIATAGGESKWITGERARAYGMKLRQGADAILVGINTILADDPSLTVRSHAQRSRRRKEAESIGFRRNSPPDVGGYGRLRRIVLDSAARTPLQARVVSDEHAGATTIVVGRAAPQQRVKQLSRLVNVLVAPVRGEGRIDLRWLLRTLGSEKVTSLLVEGGGEVNGSFLLGGFAQRIAFFYAPKILGGHQSRKAVAGEGAATLKGALRLKDVEWRRLGEDWLLTARC